MLKTVFAIIVIVLLSGIYDQLSLSNMTEQQRAEYVEASQKDAETRADSHKSQLQDAERVASLRWDELQSNDERSTWISHNVLPWILCLLMLGAFWSIVQMVLEQRKRGL